MVSLALLVLSFSAPLAHARSWAVYSAGGVRLGKITAVSHAGYGGPGARVWYRGDYCAKIGRDWTELGMVKNVWVIYEPAGGTWASGQAIRRVGSNRYTGLDRTTGSVWLRAVRGRRSGPWRVQVFADGRWETRARTPRSCPGAYAAGALVIYSCLAQ